MTEQKAIEEFNLLKKTRMFIPRNDTIDIVINALEKQIPKEPIIKRGCNWTFKCPSCNKLLYWTDELNNHGSKDNYCPYCGQAIKWE